LIHFYKSNSRDALEQVNAEKEGEGVDKLSEGEGDTSSKWKKVQKDKEDAKKDEEKHL